MGLFSGTQRREADYPYRVEPPLHGGGGQAAYSSSFTQVNVNSTDSALRKVAVWASVNLVAGLVSGLPLDGYTDTAGGRRQVPLPRFFDDPDATGQGAEDWLYQLLTAWLLRGNGCGRVLDRGTDGKPTLITLAHPDSVAHWLDNDGHAHWRFGKTEVPIADVWHRRVFPVPGRTMGLSPIALHATTISQGLAASAFGLRWFTDGGHPSAILQNESADVVTQAQATTVKARFLAAIRGTREPVVLGKGWKYQAIQISPEESQFLDTQRYTAAECARIFGPGVPEVLGYETGGSLTYSNVEQRSLDLLKFTLDRWLTRVEKVLTRDVMPDGSFVKFNRGALLSTDLLTRYRAHEIALRNQFKTVNEVRGHEDAAPVEWGDTPNAMQGVSEPNEAAELVTMVQKVYLGVGTVLTSEEARDLLNQAGANLALPGPFDDQPGA